MEEDGWYIWAFSKDPEDHGSIASSLLAASLIME